MIEQGWCDKITHLLSLPDHESRETTLNLMTTLAEQCQTIFVKSKDKLYQIEQEYKTLSHEDEEGDFYFRHIAQLTLSLIRIITQTTSLPRDRVEL